MSDKSAAAVALACTTLRDLCHGHLTQLNLSSISDSNTATVRAVTQPLSKHFPSCELVTLALNNANGYLIAPSIIDSLSRYELSNSPIVVWV